MKTKMLTNEQTQVFCGALAQLIHGGIGLGDGLLLMAEEEQEKGYQDLLRNMAARADSGAGLPQIMEEAGSFPSYACALVRVGQRTGKLEQSLEALHRYYAARARLQRQIRGALVYPAVLLGVLLAVAVVLLVWVLPVFAEVYAQLGVGLSGVAGWLMKLGAVLKAALPGLGIVLAAVAAALAVPAVRAWLYRWWARHFGDGRWGRKLLSARFVYALSVAVASGLEAPEAAELALGVAREEAKSFQVRCEDCRSALEAGDGLGAALSKGGFLIPQDKRLLEAATRSGRQDEMLQQIAQDMLDRGEEALAARTARLEPGLVVAGCVLIGGVLLAVMLPLISIMNAIG